MQPGMQCDGAAPPVPGGPHLNALKHGLRSTAILLPGDDAAEFQALRRELFHTYQPCTVDEADCVESMAGYKWRIARCRRRQAGYEAALDAVIAGSPEGHLCEPDPHRWQHRSMDCVLEEMRLHRLMTRDRATLFELQRMRRNRLIDGALVARDYRAFLADEEPSDPAEHADRVLPDRPATRSNDGQNGDFRKRTLSTGLARVLRAREVSAAPSIACSPFLPSPPMRRTLAGGANSPGRTLAGGANSPGRTLAGGASNTDGGSRGSGG